MTAPPLKWVGGKTRLLPELVARLPKDWSAGVYHELFFGGGALFFHLEPERAVINDQNAALMSAYEEIAYDAGVVIKYLRAMERAHRRNGKRFYEVTRGKWNSGWYDRGVGPRYKGQKAAALIYLNRTCFNGLWRENANGEFNVPMGRYGASHTICNAEGIRAAARVLKRSTIYAGSYASLLVAAGAGDFVYMDPPYDPVSETASFTGYQRGGFGEMQQAQLAYLAGEAVRRGVRVMLSNSDTTLVRKLYRDQGFRLHTVQCGRSINSKATARGKVRELIITGGYKV